MHLELTDRTRLRPGRPAPRPVLARPERPEDPLVRETHDRVAVSYNWSSLEWSDALWSAVMVAPRMRHWSLRVGDEVVGLVSIESHLGGDAEITVFGLVPEWVGRGYGAAALCRAVELAWAMPPEGAEAVRRVRLHTSSRDHPHALPNYLARGFRRVRPERR